MNSLSPKHQPRSTAFQSVPGDPFTRPLYDLARHCAAENNRRQARQWELNCYRFSDSDLLGETTTTISALIEVSYPLIPSPVVIPRSALAAIDPRPFPCDRKLL